MTESSLKSQALSELRRIKEGPTEPVPTDIDIVWVLSGHGTALTEQETGLFKGRSRDRERIDAGIALVKEVTGLRLKKSPSEVTIEDIEQVGPVLFYNGETEQNEAIHSYMSDANFPLPKDKMIIAGLDEIYTPGQMKSFAKHLQGNERTVAVVTHADHIPRTDRYLEKYQPKLGNVGFVFRPVPETEKPVGAVWGELKRLAPYVAKGDLAPTPLSRRYI